MQCAAAAALPGRAALPAITIEFTVSVLAIALGVDDGFTLSVGAGVGVVLEVADGVGVEDAEGAGVGLFAEVREQVALGA